MLDHTALELDREGIKGREDGERGRGGGGRLSEGRNYLKYFSSKEGDYSGEVINRGTAITRGNMVTLSQDFFCSGYFKCDLIV